MTFSKGRSPGVGGDLAAGDVSTLLLVEFGLTVVANVLWAQHGFPGWAWVVDRWPRRASL